MVRNLGLDATTTHPARNSSGSNCAWARHDDTGRSLDKRDSAVHIGTTPHASAYSRETRSANISSPVVARDTASVKPVDGRDAGGTASAHHSGGSTRSADRPDSAMWTSAPSKDAAVPLHAPIHAPNHAASGRARSRPRPHRHLASTAGGMAPRHGRDTASQELSHGG